MAKLNYSLKNFLEPISEFQENQDNSFLQKVQGLKAFSFDYSNNLRSKHFAKFSKDGKLLRMFRSWKVYFVQSVSHYHGIYRIFIKTHLFYIGISFSKDNSLIHFSHDFNALFKDKGKLVVLKK